MKNKGLILIIMLLYSFTCQAQKFTIKYQSKPGNPPAFLKKQVNFQENLNFDFNNDGTDDLVSIFWPIDCCITVNTYRGYTDDVLWSMDIPGTNNGQSNFNSYGFADLGDGSVSAVFATPSKIFIVNTEEKQVAFEYDRLNRIIAFADVDNDSYLDIIANDRSGNYFIVIGLEPNNFNGPPKHGPLNDFSKAGEDFELFLKYESQENQRLAFSNIDFLKLDDLDMNGDGILDISTLAEPEGEPEGMSVLDGPSKDVLWKFPFPEEYIQNILNGGFHGFFDVNGDGRKEVLLGDNLIVSIEKNIKSIGENFKIKAVIDIDMDGILDLIGIDTNSNTVQVWGQALSTPTFDYELALGRLGQNYPNPFYDNTTITYSLKAPARVRLNIFDLNGWLIETLVDTQQAAGEYLVDWGVATSKAGNIPAGQYYYQLNVNGQVLTKKMIIVN